MDWCRARGLSRTSVAYTESRLERWGRWLKKRRPRVAIEQIGVDLITNYMHPAQLSIEGDGPRNAVHDAWLWLLPGQPGPVEDEPAEMEESAESHSTQPIAAADRPVAHGSDVARSCSAAPALLAILLALQTVVCLTTIAISAIALNGLSEKRHAR